MEKNAIGTGRQTLRSNPGQPVMAGHHWTGLQGWKTWSGGGTEVTSHDLARSELPAELLGICDAEAEPIGGLLLRDAMGDTHMLMLSGQCALEERITVENAMWLLSCAEPAWRGGRAVRVEGDPVIGTRDWMVAAISNRSAVDPSMQRRTAARAAELARVQA